MRRNLRLNWRALALLGALLLLINPRAGMAFALTTISNQSTSSTQTNSNNSNSSNSSNQFSSNSSIQSDHSHNSPLHVPRREYSLDQNQSISAEFNMRTLNTTATISNQSTAIHTSTTATPSSSSGSTTATVADADRLGFIFSSAPREHLAILSRTERSIRHHNQHQHQHHQQSAAAAATATAAGSNSNSNRNFIGSKSKRLNNYRNNLHINSSRNNNPNSSSSSFFSNLDRNERSTISHLAGPSRKIELYMKNHILQILPDGTVNGTQNEQSEYTILQRSTVDVGLIKIQSVATCLYLCMDSCGAVYASKEFDDDCVFNENMGLHNYNTYSSTYNSNERRVYYLALNGKGVPRRTQIPPTRTLGKLATYTNAITETVSLQRVEQLIAKNFGANRVKHGVRQLCDTGKPLIELIDAAHFRQRPKCSNGNGNGNGNSNMNSSSRSRSSSSSSSTSSNSNSSSSSSSSNVPVPELSPSSLTSISNGSQSESGHISNSSRSNIRASTSTSSSINSNSNIYSSSSSNSNTSSSSSSNGSNRLSSNPHKGRKKVRGPLAERCRQRHLEWAKSGGLGPKPDCGKKAGKVAKGKGAAAARGAMQKPKAGGKRKSPKAGGKPRPNGPKRQRPLNGAKRNGPRRQQRLFELTSTTASTSTSTTMASSLATPNDWESSSPLPALSLSETSDRVERNVRDEKQLDEDEDQDEDDDSLESDSQEDPDGSYENATLEAQARGSALDDSIYYDQFAYLRLLLLQLLIMLCLGRSTAL